MTITKDLILGAKVVSIHETYEITDDGLDLRVAYFTVDRGFTFNTPWAGRAWNTDEIPSGAEEMKESFVSYGYDVKQLWFGIIMFAKLPHETIETPLRRIRQCAIAGIFCGKYHPEIECHHPLDGIIVFSDGGQAYNNRCSPHGTGSAGLHYSEPCRGTPDDELVDYFETV